jgi:hypothetical protein
MLSRVYAERLSPIHRRKRRCLTPRSRGDPTRRATLGPRRAVAGSIVLRGPRAAHLAGRLSSNVRPHEFETEAHPRARQSLQPQNGEDEVKDERIAGAWGVWRRSETGVGSRASSSRREQRPGTEGRGPRTRTEKREPKGTECGRSSECYLQAATQGFTREAALSGKVMLVVTNRENREPQEAGTGSRGPAAKAGAH